MIPDKRAEDAASIFNAALLRVNPTEMVKRCLAVKDGKLVAKTELEEAVYDLSVFNRVMVIAFGKAGASMALGAEAVLGDRLSDGLAAVKEGHLETLTTVRLVEASHPVPDARSAAAAAEILALAETADERTFVLVLISGGGSALLCSPAQGISLADKAATTKLLLASGAAIHEVNCVRKHLSAVKGGQLAAALAPATVLSLVLSDVIGDDLDTIASGPTVPDSTTFADSLKIVTRYGILDALPASVVARLRDGASGLIPDTPKPGAQEFARTRNMLIGTNRLALMAAGAKAKELGYATLELTSRLSGEAREAAGFLHGIGLDIASSGFPLALPACLIAGGETTVTLRGKGKGGRNQEMALAFLAELGRSSKGLPDSPDGRILFLAASTDGSDGPTDAAGAFASVSLLEAAGAKGLDPSGYLENNDSYAFFDHLDGLLKTGPTNTNVCDLAIMIVTE